MTKCEICGFENPDGHLYCGRCGSGMSSSDAAGFGELGSPIEGERKQVTVIFADISGFTALNDAAQTPAQVEQVIQIANHVMNDLSEVVYEYDGYIDKFMGDAIMALFGAPVAHENDPERALRAVLDMMKTVEAFNQNPPFPLAEPLGIHMGINTGTVIAGLVGTKRKRSYTVMGDVVNVASRLEHVSERGEILVGQETYNLTKRLFVFKEREAVQVKGKEEPLQNYELIGERSQSTTDDFATGLVGRHEEMAILRQEITNLNAGRGGIVAIVGEAGLGKSRLVAELQLESSTRDSDTLWFEGRGLSYRQNVSYKLFVEILRQYLGANADEPSEILWHKWQAIGESLFGTRRDEVIPYLATMMGIKLPEQYTQNMPLSEPQVLQQRMFLAVGEWVEALAAQTPMVLVFEDLHWADENSVHLIQYLMTVTTHLPLLVICLARPEHESFFWHINQQALQDYGASYTQISLDPLSQEQSRVLVAELLETDKLPSPLESPILKRTEGNPLFMEEVVKSLIEDGTLTRLNGNWNTSSAINAVDIEQKIPNTLTGVLTARIDRLGDAIKRTLQIAAVIGRTFQHSVLTAVSDDPEKLDDHLTILMGTGLLRQATNETEEAYVFRHALTHETVYNNLLLQQRRIYHRKIADYMSPWYYLRGEEYASIIAHHYVQGEAWDRALKYLIRAAEASRSIFDNDNAVRFYTQALDPAKLEDDTESQAQIYAGRGKIFKRLGRVPEARDDFEKLLQLAETDQNASQLMQALVELGKLRAGSPNFSQAEQYFEKALLIARQIEDKTGLADTLNELGEFKLNMGQLEETKACYNEALPLARDLGRTYRIATCEDGLAAVILYQGYLDTSIAELEKLVHTWRDIGDHQGLMKTNISLATAYTLQGQYEKSNRICQEIQESYERTGDQNWLAPLKIAFAQNAFGQGDLSRALTELKDAIASAQGLNNGIWHSAGLAQYSHCYLYLGQEDLAQKYSQEAVSLAEATGSPLWTSRAKIIAGVIARLSDNYEIAQVMLETELKTMQGLGFVPDAARIQHHLLEIYLATNQLEKMAAILQNLLSLTENGNLRVYQAKALKLEGQLAARHQNYGMAIEKLNQAKNIAQGVDNQLTALAVNLALAKTYLQVEQTDTAQTMLTEAKMCLNKIAASIQDPDLKDSFLNGHLASHLRQIGASLTPV